MSVTCSALYYHLVLSTNQRVRHLYPDVCERLYPYIGGVIRQHGGILIAAGGIEDHCHLLPKLPTTVQLSKVIGALKGSTSYWLKKEWPYLHDFAWQSGYFIATISPDSVAKSIDYIRNQKRHHASQNSEDEFLHLMQCSSKELG